MLANRVCYLKTLGCFSVLTYLIVFPGLIAMDTFSLEDYELFAAAAHGEDDKLKQLLAAGANKDVQKPWGSTPLFFAAEMGKVVCVKALLTVGADTSLTTEGETALDVAIRKSKNEFLDVDSCKRYNECVRVLEAVKTQKSADTKKTTAVKTIQTVLDHSPIGSSCGDESLLERWQSCCEQKEK